MSKKTTTAPATDSPEDRPFDLLAELERPNDQATRAATLGPDLTINIQTSWTGVEAVRVSTALAGSLEDVVRALVPDEQEATAAWAFLGELLNPVAARVVSTMLKVSGLATDGGFLAPSASSETPAGGAEQ